MENIRIRDMKSGEIGGVSSLISAGYHDDMLFKWLVPDTNDRHPVVSAYYSVYLRARGCICYVAEDIAGEMLGASVWLPHDTDPSTYDEVDRVTGRYCANFRSVTDKSHYSEPPLGPFYQLVGFGVDKNAQGKGIGSALLTHSLSAFDSLNIPTYLEASTPYYGKGVYGKFGYKPIGEIMIFSDTAVLTPLWRHVGTLGTRQRTSFGGYNWLVLAVNGSNRLLLADDFVLSASYHDYYEEVLWAQSYARKYLNDTFYDGFCADDKSRIVKTQLQDEASWDNVFLLSLEEAVKYLGDSEQLINPTDKFYIDDDFNAKRRLDNPCRWPLRTPGSSLSMVTAVTIDGRISLSGDFVNRQSTPLFKVGLRPAMWVSF